MYCSNCGHKLEDEDRVCPECGKEVKTESKEVKQAKETKQILNVCPISLIALMFAGMSFLFGFILITASLVSGFGATWFDTLVVLPAFASLSVGVYKLLTEKEDKTVKLVAWIIVGLSAFTILYTFISYLVMIV